MVKDCNVHWEHPAGGLVKMIMDREGWPFVSLSADDSVTSLWELKCSTLLNYIQPNTVAFWGQTMVLDADNQELPQGCGHRSTNRQQSLQCTLTKLPSTLDMSFLRHVSDADMSFAERVLIREFF